MQTQAAARIFGLRLHVLEASADRDFETMFATLAQLSQLGEKSK
jgi:hypothetical protein